MALFLIRDSKWSEFNRQGENFSLSNVNHFFILWIIWSTIIMIMNAPLLCYWLLHGDIEMTVGVIKLLAIPVICKPCICKKGIYCNQAFETLIRHSYTLYLLWALQMVQ